jgi:hypothetical protein
MSVFVPSCFARAAWPVLFRSTRASLGAWCCALVLVLSGCSHDKEQCHTLSLAILEADGAYQGLSSAAAHGNRAKFESSSKEFEAALQKVRDVEVTGDSLKASTNKATKRRYLEHGPKIVAAYRHLLEAVEKNPKLGEKHSGGVALLTSTDDVPEETQEADREVRIAGSMARTRKCE